MSDNVEKTKEFYARCLNEHNLEIVGEFVAVDSTDHTPPPMPGFEQGLEGMRKLMQMWFNAFPDVRLDVEDIFGDGGDKVVARISWTGTHKGSMMGEEPTGKQVTGQLIEILKFADGKVTDRWGYGTDAEVFGALGIGPPG